MFYTDSLSQLPPLLLLHSGGMTHAEWQPQQALLAKHYRLILPDLPGHGQTPLQRPQLRIQDMGRAVLDLLDRLEISAVHLCGSSLGGAVGLWLTVHYPQRIRTVALYRMGYRKSAKILAETRTIATPAYWQRFGLEDKMSVLHMAQGGPEAWKQVIARVAECFNPQDSDHFYHLEQLAQIEQPVFLIAGDRDPLVPLEMLLEMMRTLPAAELWVLPGADHITATNTWRASHFALELHRFIARQRQA